MTDPAKRPISRMRSSLEFARVKRECTAFRGRFCVLLALAAPGEQSQIGFIASKRSVGNAVQRNRARRRLREIVRLRWTRVPEDGYRLVLIASRSALTAEHQDLAAEVEHLLAAAGALAPVELPGA